MGIRWLMATADLPQCWWPRDELGIDAAVPQSQVKTLGAKLQVRLAALHKGAETGREQRCLRERGGLTPQPCVTASQPSGLRCRFKKPQTVERVRMRVKSATLTILRHLHSTMKPEWILQLCTYPLIGLRDDVIGEALRGLAGSVLGSFQGMVQEALRCAGDHSGNQRPDGTCRLLPQQTHKQDDKPWLIDLFVVLMTTCERVRRY